jgi:hypothetical protein
VDPRPDPGWTRSRSADGHDADTYLGLRARLWSVSAASWVCGSGAGDGYFQVSYPCGAPGGLLQDLMRGVRAAPASDEKVVVRSLVVTSACLWCREPVLSV